jgi:hydroxymethylpyrimidine/phosphomethylpyrimidine kinase
MRGRVLIIAGSDSGGGAGIQADVKTVTALGGYAMTAITAITAQNTLGVQDIHPIPPEMVARQIKSVLSDIGADAIKIGMLCSIDIINAVHDAIADYAVNIPVVVDPVMIATSGDSLLEAKANATLRQKIITLATLVTPNRPEAEALAGTSVGEDEDYSKIGSILCSLGSGAVLLTGGHMSGNILSDQLFVEGEMVQEFKSERIETPHTHGTGCTLSSAIAAGLAQGMEMEDAIKRAKNYVHEAIRSAPGFGHGHGPLNHGHPLNQE